MANELELSLKFALKELVTLFKLNSERLKGCAWLIDDNNNAIKHYSDCLTIYEQTGFDANEFKAVFGTYWRRDNNFNEIADFEDFCIVTVQYKVRFITIGDRDLSANAITAIDKQHAACKQIGEEIRRKVEALSGNEGEGMDTSDDTTNNDRDVSMVTNDSSFDSSSTETDTSMDVSSETAAVTTSTSKRKASDSTDVLRASTSNDDTTAEPSPLQSLLLDNDGKLKADVAQQLSTILSDTFGKKKLTPDEEKLASSVSDALISNGVLADSFNKKQKLTSDEMKLAGSITKAAFRSEGDKSYKQIEVVNMPVRSQNSITVVKLKKSYDKKTPSSKAASVSQQKWRQNQTAFEVMKALGNASLQEHFITQYLEDNPDLAKRLVKLFYHKHYTWNVETTCSGLAISGINPSQLKLFSRFMRSENDNIQFFCAMDAIGKLKEAWWDPRLQTRLYVDTDMTRVIRVKGQGTLTRPQTVTVFKVDPREHLLHDIQDLINTKQWIEGRRKCTVPWNIDDAFADFGIVKMMQDAGGGSWKYIQSMVNVTKPQAIEHVRIVAEYSGAKDTADNVRAACFRKGDSIRHDAEVISQRRCIVLTLTVQLLTTEETEKTDKTSTFAVAVANTDPNHDINAPSPLPPLDGITTRQAGSVTDKNKIGIVDVDFSQVNSVSLLIEDVGSRVNDDAAEEDNNTIILGYTFFSEGDEPIKTVFFRDPIKTPSVHPMPEMNQIQIGAVISPDLQFRSIFTGHQGSSSKFPCPACLTTQQGMKDIFGPSTASELRTIQMNTQGYLTFKRLFLDQEARKRTPALKTRVTQQQTFSIDHEPQADTPFDCFQDAFLHDRLGFSRTILDWLFDFFCKVEELYGGDSLSLRQNIEKEMNRMRAYESWLDNEMSDINALIGGKKSSEKDILKRLSGIQEILAIPRITEHTRAKWEASLDKVKAELETLDKAIELEDGEKEHLAQLLEIKTIAEESTTYLSKVLTKHEGIHQRIIVDALKIHGVDIKVYHSGVMDGNHCFTFSERGVEIMDLIITEMLKHFGDNATLKAAIEDFGKQMKPILATWGRIMRFLTSVDYHTDEAIDVFAADIEKMRQAVVKLIKDEPSLGEDSPLKFPSTIKAHILFDNNVNGESHVLQWVRQWHATGLFDEQNGEKSHAVCNHLKRRFGNRRGKGLKKLVMREFHWQGCSVIREKIDAALEKTKRKTTGTRRKSLPQPMASEEEHETSAIVDLPCDEDGVFVSAELTDAEAEINSTVALRGPTDPEHDDYDTLCGSLSDENKSLLVGMDTKIIACPVCFMRLIGRSAYQIHCDESHKTKVHADLDGRTETTVARVR